MEQEFAIKLFNKSPLKQRKFNVLKEMIKGEITRDSKNLDLGSDNGVISLFLRNMYKESKWYSADLTQETVDLIKSLVNENVFVIKDGERFPFEDNFFNNILIVDFLEHVQDDKLVISEIKRTLKQEGTFVLNVPNPVRGLVRFLKTHTGQTDEAHGHIRRGYNLKQVKSLIGDDFEVISYKKYGRGFSDFVDFLIIFSLRFLKRKNKKQEEKKGTLFSNDDLNKFKKTFKIYSILYPLFKVVVFLDSLFFFLPCNMLCVKLRKK